MLRLGEKSRPCNPIKQSIKLFAFTTEAQRSQRENFFVCRGGADRQKVSVSNKSPLPEGGRFKEDRYLPILLENIPLSVLPAYRQVSNEPPSDGANLPARSRFGVGRWAVKMVFNVNSRKPRPCAFSVLTAGRELHSIVMTEGWKRLFTRS